MQILTVFLFSVLRSKTLLTTCNNRENYINGVTPIFTVLYSNLYYGLYYSNRTIIQVHYVDVYPSQFFYGNYEPSHSKWKVTKEELECYWKVCGDLSTTTNNHEGKFFLNNNSVLCVATSNTEN